MVRGPGNWNGARTATSVRVDSSCSPSIASRRKSVRDEGERLETVVTEEREWRR